MRHAVPSLHATEPPFAHDHARGPEGDWHRLAGGAVHEVDLATRLAGLHPVAQLDKGLEQARVGREDETVPAPHLHQAGWRRILLRLSIRRHAARMDKQITDPPLNHAHPCDRHAAATAELPPQRHDAAPMAKPVSSVCAQTRPMGGAKALRAAMALAFSSGLSLLRMEANGT